MCDCWSGSECDDEKYKSGLYPEEAKERKKLLKKVGER